MEEKFKESCKNANVQPSKRQWKKYQQKKGIAYGVEQGRLEPLFPNFTNQPGWKPPR